MKMGKIKRRMEMKKVVLFFLALVLLVGYEFTFGMDKAKVACLPSEQKCFGLTMDNPINDLLMKPRDSGPTLLCWKIEKQVDTDFVDKYIKVIVTGGFQHRLLNGIFYNTDGVIAPVAGTMTINANDTRRISLQGTYVDGDENLHIVILDATVDSKTKNGTVYVRRDSGVTTSFDLTRIPCKTLPAPPE
jgi:hypothetical protein